MIFILNKKRESKKFIYVSSFTYGKGRGRNRDRERSNELKSDVFH